MNSVMLDCKRYLDNELKTIEYIKTKCYSGSLISLSNTACKCYDVLKQHKGLNVCFEWKVFSPEYNKEFIINVAGLVVKNNNEIENSSYCISVSEESKGTINVLKKFHFDYVSMDSCRRQNHPIFHIQFPGEALPKWKGRNFVVEHLCPKFSEPRIIYKPMSLALVLHIAFIEFPYFEFQKIIEDSAWKNIIRKNQELLWKPYWEKCINYIKHNDLIFEVGYAKKN